uniref:HIT domain-containing protein n=1 Tax=viral metagenome TaxID=1070528 RepID=A0A6C0IR60_9ZZZZ
MELIEGNIKHKFIPTQVVSFDNINKSCRIFKNDVFSKFETTLLVKGEYILCEDISKLKTYSKRITKESYQEYCEYIRKRGPSKDQWIYNIIRGTDEQDKVLYRNSLCVVIPTYTWDTKNVDKLHMLVTPTDTSLRSIRDLNVSHINLLKHMKIIGLVCIEENYGLEECNLKMFFHYDPSTYHLHIHFINVNYIECFSSIEYSHDLDLVIFNLGIDTDYYKKVLLNTRR